MNAQAPTSTPGAMRALIGFFLAVLAATFVADFCNPRPPKLELFMGRRSKNLWNGKVARSLDAYFQKRSLVFTQIRPMLAVPVYRLTGEVQTSVGVGRDGWLFHQWELEDRGVEGERATERGIETLGHLNALLKAHNVELLMVVVPNKVRIYPEFMYPGGKMPAFMESKYRRFVQRVREQGIQSIDLEGAFRGTRQPAALPAVLYHTADHHWTDRGCFDAATRIFWATRPWHPEWVSQKQGLARLHSRVWVGGSTSLYNMLGFPNDGLKSTFVQDVERLEVVYDKPVSDAERAASPVILTGDSFAGFEKRMASFLEFALQSPIRDESMMGGEVHGGISKWLQGGGLNDTRPRMLVCVFWEATIIGHDLHELRETIAPYQKKQEK